MSNKTAMPHTSGPWLLVDGNVETQGGATIAHPDRHELCPIGEAEQVANMALCAAAPDTHTHKGVL